jgi:hypothetical protein
MSEETSLPPPATTQAPGLGRVFGGIVLGTCWVLAHVVLFYLIFVSSFLIDLLVAIVRPILFPGEASRTMELSEEGTWARLLTIGLWLSGAAGVPLGLRVFWRAHARLLKRVTWLLVLAGVAFGAAAFVTLAKSGF